MTVCDNDSRTVCRTDRIITEHYGKNVLLNESGTAMVVQLGGGGGRGTPEHQSCKKFPHSCFS